jgi:hypothetical protein
MNSRAFDGMKSGEQFQDRDAPQVILISSFDVSMIVFVAGQAYAPG